MQGTITTIAPDGAITIKTYTAEIPLEDLNEAVGGYIESVPFFTTYEGRECVVFCNEHGKIKDLPRNEPANKLWDALLAAYPKPLSRISDGREVDYLVGTIAIIQGDREFMRAL